jgi:hypothetical protein
MKSIDTARSIPLAAGPNVTAVIDRTRKRLIELRTTEPANHFPESQHCFMSHFHNGARTFERGTHPPARAAVDAARLAAPDSKTNPEAPDRDAVHKTPMPVIRVTA